MLVEDMVEFKLGMQPASLPATTPALLRGWVPCVCWHFRVAASPQRPSGHGTNKRHPDGPTLTFKEKLGPCAPDGATRCGVCALRVPYGRWVCKKGVLPVRGGPKVQLPCHQGDDALLIRQLPLATVS